jgi:hypothetical protein
MHPGVQEAEQERKQADDLEAEATSLQQTGSLESAEQQLANCQEIRARAATAASASAALRLKAEQAKHSAGSSKRQATVTQEHLALLEKAILTVRAAMDAASRSEELTQQAAEDLRASGEAKEQAKQLAEQLQYALKEAQDAEAQAEALANDGQMEASMDMLASASRCAPLFFMTGVFSNTVWFNGGVLCNACRSTWH